MKRSETYNLKNIKPVQDQLIYSQSIRQIFRIKEFDTIIFLDL